MKEFLDKYHTVIFDMDGVITSEQNYWNSAALTVWEFMKRNRKENIDAAWGMANLASIRERVFCCDRLIATLKERGVNSNWDLGYVTVCLAWICGVTDDFSPVLDLAKTLPDNILNEYDNIVGLCAERTGVDREWLKHNGLMWQTMRGIFQEWFLGDELFFEQYGYLPINQGKSGLLFKEKPIIDMAKLKKMLCELSREKRVCIGTGRPKAEIIEPLKGWDCIKYFAEDGIITYDNVERAQERLMCDCLAKPHPYMFLKALFGENYDDERIARGDYDKALIHGTLVVGDAGADILAARAMHADFCAVLTGVDGENGRKYFEDMKAEYILKNAEELI